FTGSRSSQLAARSSKFGTDVADDTDFSVVRIIRGELRTASDELRLSSRLERVLEFFGEGREIGWSGFRACPEFAQFVGLLRVLDGFRAQTDAPACGIHFEDDDLDLGADRERPGDVGVLLDTRFAHGNEPGAAGRQKYEDPELLVTLDLALEARAGRD